MKKQFTKLIDAFSVSVFLLLISTTGVVRNIVRSRHQIPLKIT